MRALIGRLLLWFIHAEEARRAVEQPVEYLELKAEGAPVCGGVGSGPTT